MALLKEGVADEDDPINCRARYNATSHEYAQFSDAMGLPQQRERVYGDGLGTKLMQGKTEGGSGTPSPIKTPKENASVTDRVTNEERTELLKHPRTEYGLTSVANGAIIKLPEQEAQLAHIFEDREGHIPRTSENMKLLVDLANSWENYRGTDAFGNAWHIKSRDDNSQVWVRS